MSFDYSGYNPNYNEEEEAEWAESYGEEMEAEEGPKTIEERICALSDEEVFDLFMDVKQMR